MSGKSLTETEVEGLIDEEQFLNQVINGFRIFEMATEGTAEQV